MEIVKKNLVSILCLVVALLAVAGTFYPLGSKFDSLRDEVDTSAQAAAQLERLKSTPRTIPGIGTNGTSIPLPCYPTQDVFNWMNDTIKGKLAKQAADLQAAAEEISHRGHDAMTANSLPEPSNSAPFLFKDDYTRHMDHLKAEILHSCLPPSMPDIQEKINELLARIRLQEIRVNDKVMNDKELKEQFDRESKLLPMQLRIKRATQEKYRMYVMPEALAVTEPYIKESPKKPTPNEIWFAQVGYWVAQDVCDAIALTNANSNSVPESPVRALVTLNLPLKMEMYVMPATSQQNASGKTVADPYLVAKPDAAHPPIYTLSPTGRAVNSLYDVVQFTMTVYMDPQYVEIFARNLSKDRFITIKEMNLSPFWPSESELNAGVGQGQGGFAAAGGTNTVVTGYYYGQSPKLAKVEFKCEEVMMRSWTLSLMPPTIKAELHVDADKSK
jgi:hypothetical protein